MLVAGKYSNKIFKKNIMKNLLSYLMFVSMLFACNTNSSEQIGANIPTKNLRVETPQNSITQIIHDFQKASSESGLDNLIWNKEGKYSWENLDAYYMKIDSLSYSNDIKRMLKQKATTSLIEQYRLLEKGSNTKKEFYADEILNKDLFNVDLAYKLTMYFKDKWSKTKLLEVKNKMLNNLNSIEANTQKRYVKTGKFINEQSLKGGIDSTAIGKLKSKHLSKIEKIRALRTQIENII